MLTLTEEKQHRIRSMAYKNHLGCEMLQKVWYKVMSHAKLPSFPSRNDIHYDILQEFMSEMRLESSPKVVYIRMRTKNRTQVPKADLTIHLQPRAMNNGYSQSPTASTSASLPPDPTEVLDKLRELVTPAYLQHETSAVHIRAMALTGRLKSLYRQANAATRQHKEQTAAARQEMDQSHLQLQNLLYEKRHLEREIEKCRQFAYAP
jgi:hypothetical protein